MAEEFLYRPEWFDLLWEGKALSFRYTELPVEVLLFLSHLAEEYPGLQFNLRKQRGRGKCYLLTILPHHHLDKEKGEVKGEP